MVPVDRDTSLNQNQFTKSMSLPASVDSDFDLSANASGSSSSQASSSNASNSTASNVNEDILSPEEENKKSIEDFLGKIDSNLAKTKKYVKNRWVDCFAFPIYGQPIGRLDWLIKLFGFDCSQSSIAKLASIEDNDYQENTHSAAAYALSSSSYHSGGYGGTSNGGTQMVVTHGKRVKSSLHRLEEQQDEFYQL